MGILTAFLTMIIRFFVPESHKWEEEKEQGRTNGWATIDLMGVLFGSFACFGILYLWAIDCDWAIRGVGTCILLIAVTIGYLWPIRNYLSRNNETAEFRKATLSMMMVAAGLSGVALRVLGDPFFGLLRGLINCPKAWQVPSNTPSLLLH